MKKWIIYSFICINTSGLNASLLDSANYYFEKSDFRKATSFYEKELKTNTSIDLLRKYGKSLELSYQYEKSLKYYLSAKELSMQLKNDSMLFVLSADIADLYRTTGDHNRALMLYGKINIPSKYKALTARKYHRLAATYNEIGKIDTALFYSKQSIEMSKEISHLDYFNKSNNEIANIFEKKGALDSAFFYYKLACDFWKKDSNLRYYANGYYNLAHKTYLLRDFKYSNQMLMDNLQLIKGKKIGRAHV